MYKYCKYVLHTDININSYVEVYKKEKDNNKLVSLKQYKDTENIIISFRENLKKFNFSRENN